MSAFIGKTTSFATSAGSAGERFAPSGKRGFLRIAASAVVLMASIGVGASLADAAYPTLGHDSYNFHSSDSTVPANDDVQWYKEMPTWDLPNADRGVHQFVHTAGSRNP